MSLSAGVAFVNHYSFVLGAGGLWAVASLLLLRRRGGLTAQNGLASAVLGGAIGLGYVPSTGESEADILAASYEIEIAGERFAAEAALKPMYDPKSERVRQ